MPWYSSRRFLVRCRIVSRTCLLVSTLVGLAILVLSADPNFLWEKVPTQSSAPSRSQAAKILKSLRLLEGRLSGGFPYSPYRLVRPSQELVRLAREIGERDRGPLRETVVLDLLDQNPRRAIGRLRRAVELRPNEATHWSDLSAVYLELFKSTRQPYDLVEALVASDRAVHLAPTLAEANFNLALSFEKLFLTSQARAAWSMYLVVDKSSPWATEARQHLHLLAVRKESELWDQQKTVLDKAASRREVEQVRQLVDRFRQFARLHVENELLPAWGKATLERRTLEQSNLLQVAGIISNSLQELTGDRLLSDSVAVVRSALASQDARIIAVLARGHIAYGNGVTLDKAGRDAEALAEFARSAEWLKAGVSPFSDSARVIGAYSEFYLGRHAAVAGRLQVLPEQLVLRHYFSLASNARRLLGLAHFRLANLEVSLSYYREALDDALRIGECESVAASYFMLAENLRFQGESEEAWRDRYHALELATTIGRTIYRHNAMFDTAEALLKSDRPKSALFFQNEMVNAAIEAGDPFLITETLLRRSRTELRLGKMNRARLDTVAASEWLAKLPSEPRRDQLEADIKTSLGEIELKTEPLHAVVPLGEALGFSKRAQLVFRLPPLFHKYALALLRVGRVVDAESELRQGIEESERQRARVLDDQLRITYSDQVQPIFDEMIRLQAIRSRNIESSFNYSERGRTRNFLEAVLARGARRTQGDLPIAAGTVSLQGLQQSLDPGIAIVQYTVLEECLLIWTVTHQRADLTRVNISARDLAVKVYLLNACLNGKCELGKALILSQDLYDLLVRRIPALDRGQALIVVPDKDLTRVPFAALVNRLTGRYLIEDRVIGYSPSSTLYLNAVHRSRSLEGRRVQRALVLGNPAFDPRSFPNTPSLPAAEREAHKIGNIYPGASVLIGADATRKAFLTAVPDSDVVHLATHARINDEYPLLSMLLLAKDPHSSGKTAEGAVYAYDVYGLRLNQTRIVVLSGCETLGGKAWSEGIGSLARPFLAAGVPTVVGTLWKVEDRNGLRFFEKFHRQLRSGQDALRALRAVQLEFLSNDDPSLRKPQLWAAYQAVGAGF